MCSKEVEVSLIETARWCLKTGFMYVKANKSKRRSGNPLNTPLNQGELSAIKEVKRGTWDQISIVASKKRNYRKEDQPGLVCQEERERDWLQVP